MTNPLAGIPPEVLANLSPAQLQALLNPGTGAPAGAPAAGADDFPDLNNAEEGGTPKLLESVVDVEILGMSSWLSEDPTRPKVPIFGLDFKIYNIVSQDPPRPRLEKVDENPPPGPMKVGEQRRWTANVENTKGNKNAFRIRELMQALLRFVPSSKEADTAIGPDGKAVNWNEIAKEARSKENPLAGRKVRITTTRIITQRGKGFAMYVPTFSLPDDVEKRTSNVVTLL